MSKTPPAAKPTVVKIVNPKLLAYFNQNPETSASDIAEKALMMRSGASELKKNIPGRHRKHRDVLYVKISNPGNLAWLSRNRRENGELQNRAAEKAMIDFLGLVK